MPQRTKELDLVSSLEKDKFEAFFVENLKIVVIDPVTQCTTLPNHSRSLNRLLFHFSRRFTHFYRLSHSELVDIEKVAVSSSLRSLKLKHTIKSRAKRSSINFVRTLFQYTCLSHNVKTRNILRVLRIILVILPEHPSDTNVFAVKMEILPEPTSNKLCGSAPGSRVQGAASPGRVQAAASGWGPRGDSLAVVRLTEPKMKNLGEKGIDCIFIGYAEHSKCYRFYVIEPNDYVSVNSIIESRDAIFDEERFTSIPRPRGGSMDLSNCNDSRDVAFLERSSQSLKQANQKQWHQKFDDVVLSNGFSLNQVENQVNKTKEFLSSNFDMKDLGEAEVILAGNEAEWLRNLVYEIPLWLLKRCLHFLLDVATIAAATLAKAYSQV
ncbi:zinc finger, CCHC-type containing protein [Tanacetum coccineum]